MQLALWLPRGNARGTQTPRHMKHTCGPPAGTAAAQAGAAGAVVVGRMHAASNQKLAIWLPQGEPRNPGHMKHTYEPAAGTAAGAGAAGATAAAAAVVVSTICTYFGNWKLALISLPYILQSVYATVPLELF